VQDANGPAGTGYDLINVSGGLLNLTAAANTLTFNLVSLLANGNSGDAVNFNAANNYSWTFATSASAITGFSAGQFHLDASSFTNNLAGGTFSFSLSSDQKSLLLNFAPVPEPSTWALLATGLGTVVLVSRRRRRG
jgi:hypothetical protein